MGDLNEHRDMIEMLEQAYAGDRIPVPSDSAFLSEVRAKLLTRWLIGASVVVVSILVVLIVFLVIQLREAPPMPQRGADEHPSGIEQHRLP